MDPDEDAPWRAECKICCYATSGPTSWGMEDRADAHTADRPGHTVDVFQEGAQ